MRALGIWLIVVGLVRLSSVWFGFFDIWALRMAVFSQTDMTEIHGRTFGTWTLLTCTMCIICAYNLDNKPLYLATLLSFVYALGHFVTEVFIFNTMAIKNLATVSLFAVPSLVWMIVEYRKWTWATTILQRSNVACEYGVSGPFWYASGATIQFLLIGVMAIEILRKAPSAHTICESSYLVIVLRMSIFYG